MFSIVSPTSPPAPPPPVVPPPAPPPPSPTGPTADASFVIHTEGPYRVGQEIEFQAVGNRHSLLWDFGDGTTRRGLYVTHRYRDPGPVIVTLDAFAGDSTDFASRRLLIRGAPSAESLPTIYGRTNRSHKDPEYSEAAANFPKIATGKWSPRAVLCWNDFDWQALTGEKRQITAGLVELRSPRQVNLAPEVCRRLELVRYKRPRPVATLGTAIASLIFTHETLHTLGVGNEAVATCWGWQLAPFMARLLKANLAYASRIGVLLAGWYKRYNLAPGYWTRACRDGGPLDLDPESTHWP